MSTSTEIKICGLTNAEDAQFAMDAGADYLGFVLYARSPRGIDAPALRGILDRLTRPPRAIAVFVNESRQVVETVAAECALHAVQIHGDETPDAFEGLSVPVWRALHVGADTCRPDPARWPASRYVVDAPAGKKYGGTGNVADWPAARSVALAHPVMLAGGLTVENVADAICTVQPTGVDVSSGVEAEPGIKDPRQIEAFIRTARAAGTQE